MSEDNPPPPYVYDGLEPPAEPKSTAAEVSDAMKDTAHRIGDAIDAGKKPGMPEHLEQRRARGASWFAFCGISVGCGSGSAPMKGGNYSVRNG